MQTKRTINQQKSQTDLVDKANQTNRYHPSTKDNKHQKQEKIANKMQSKFKTK